MAKFDLKEHDKRMREILSPKIALADRLRESMRGRKLRLPKRR